MTKKKFAIFPSMPTPNGGLHLGHIGGPYLRADILARHLKSQNHEVVVCCGTDNYESFVTHTAKREMISPHEVCQKYVKQIHNDFNKMQIKLDAFINPFEPPYQNKFIKWHHRLLNSAINAKEVMNVTEQTAWDANSASYLTSCWLKGYCPNCQHEVTGYFCERCGDHFSHAENINIYEYKKTHNIFLQLPQQTTCGELSEKYCDMYLHFLQQQKRLLRLSVNQDWGIPYKKNNVLFTYGFIYAYFLFLGEIAACKFNLNLNTFAESSDVTNIATLGVDNFVAFYASHLGFSQLCKYKKADFFIVNQFFELENKKFSTSRKHAIWVCDLTNDITIDIIRLYLASHNILDNRANIIKEKLMNYIHDNVQWIEKILQLSQVCEIDHTADIHSLFTDEYLQFKTYLEAKNFRPDLAIEVSLRWLKKISMHSKKNCSKNFLRGLAILMQPFMPQFSEQIWQNTGLSLPITIDKFYGV